MVYDSFYAAAVEYVNTRLPLRDELLTHAKFVNFETREICEFRNVEYFIERYSAILTFSASESDQIFDEFVAYQLLTKEDIPVFVKVEHD